MSYLLICGDQLFPLDQLRADFGDPDQLSVVMVEDPELCGRRRYHQQKLTLVLGAMRRYAEALREAGYTVHYYTLSESLSLTAALQALAPDKAAQPPALLSYTAHNRGQRRWIRAACEAAGFTWEARPSPMFLTDADTFADLAGDHLPLQMGRFYRAQRKRLALLVNEDGSPTGAQWSFDEQNRRKLPKKQPVPELPQAPLDATTADVALEIAAHYPEHPGAGADLWLPTDHAGAQRWLAVFLEQRLVGFGTYEDAISQRSSTLFHSTLSPLLNLGLLTPQQVLDAVLTHAEQHDVPLNDLEGFVRQLIGWREFIYGVYERHGVAMGSTNQRSQHRHMLPGWHQGTLGIPPFDDAVATLARYGWNHHIDRLMVIANLMNLAQIEPSEVYEFFMANYIDAYEWVMVPNVFGMGLNSDDNTFATKPYICGSNYWLKMSDYRKGDWCQVVDGLYWQFVERHRETLAGNPRTAMMPRNLDRLSGDRRQAIFSAADQFLDTHTQTGAA